MIAAYHALLKRAIAEHLQYRVAMVIWLLRVVLSPVIYLAVWSAVAGARGGAVGEYRLADFAGYYILLTLVNHLTMNQHSLWGFQSGVRQGSLSVMLLKPLHPIHHHAAENIASKLVALLVIIPAMGAMIVAFKPTLPDSLLAVATGTIAVVLAVGLRFVLEAVVGLSAFWLTRNDALLDVFYLLFFFLSGQAGPSSLLPASLQVGAAVTPFKWTIQFPIEALLGRLSPSALVSGMLIQLAWLAALLGLFVLLWRRGIRRYSAVGS